MTRYRRIRTNHILAHSGEEKYWSEGYEFEGRLHTRFAIEELGSGRFHTLSHVEEIKDNETTLG